jgi:hypothetical protein
MANPKLNGVEATNQTPNPPSNVKNKIKNEIVPDRIQPDLHLIADQRVLAAIP